MSFTRATLSICIAAALALAAGCMTPWTTTFAKSQPRTPTPPPPVAPPATTTASPLHSPLPQTATALDTNPDMAGVLDKLEQVRALDPTAEPKLLEQLRKTPPNSWPLVAEQFRASLAYHQQLTANEPPTPFREEALAASSRLPSSSTQPNSESLAAKTLVPPTLAAAERPSTKIGALADPRTASKEPQPVVLQTSPQTASTAFAKTETPAANLPVEPAAFQTPGDAKHVATQALATTETPAKSTDSAASAAKQAKDDADDDWQHLVQQAADDLSKRVVASPATTAEIHQHVSLRMLRLLAGDTERALEPIPHISPAEQDYWSRQVFALATYLDHHTQPDDKRRAAAAVVHLDDAVSNLRELGSLSLRNASFCKSVYGYGAIEPYETDIFSPGQQLSLYVEVENYHSQSTEKGYCTLLGASYELLDDKGKRLSGGEFPDVDDCCRSRRRDFHIQFGLTLPTTLTEGRYRVELVVKDRQSDKLGHATVPFEVRGTKKSVPSPSGRGSG